MKMDFRSFSKIALDKLNKNRYNKGNKKCREEEEYPAAGSDRENTVGVSFRTVWEKVASEQHRGSFREDGNG